MRIMLVSNVTVLYLCWCWCLQMMYSYSRTAVSAFQVKGTSSTPTRPYPRTVSSSSSSSTTALHAVAKKKKSAKKGASAVPVVNRAELVAQTADQCGLSKKDTEAAMAAFLEVIQQNVAEGKKVTLVGFGSFVPRERAARKGRNPQTGEELDIAASKSVGFSAGKSFKDRVNDK